MGVTATVTIPMLCMLLIELALSAAVFLARRVGKVEIASPAFMYLLINMTAIVMAFSSTLFNYETVTNPLIFGAVFLLTNVVANAFFEKKEKKHSDNGSSPIVDDLESSDVEEFHCDFSLRYSFGTPKIKDGGDDVYSIYCL